MDTAGNDYWIEPITPGAAETEFCEMQKKIEDDLLISLGVPAEIFAAKPSLGGGLAYKLDLKMIDEKRDNDER